MQGGYTHSSCVCILLVLYSLKVGLVTPDVGPAREHVWKGGLIVMHNEGIPTYEFPHILPLLDRALISGMAEGKCETT